MQLDEANAALSDADVCKEISILTHSMMGFWKSAKGWLPSKRQAY